MVNGTHYIFVVSIILASGAKQGEGIEAQE